MITIVGIPFGMQTMKLASLALWPFGRKSVVHNRASGCLYILFNVLWILIGGIWISLSHLVFGLLFCITIVGIPFGIQSLKMASVALWPFGKKISNADNNLGCLSTIMNIIWFFIGGIWICLTHFGFALLFYITIIGIPFGNQHMKLARLALTPFGRTIVG